MQAHADGPGAVKDECWLLVDGLEQPGDRPSVVADSWDTQSREDMVEWAVLRAQSRTSGTRVRS
jgi:hypothetical protein